MIPFLTKFDGQPLAGGMASVVPPPRFRPLAGRIEHARLRISPYDTATGTTAAQKSGLRYERAVQRMLKERFENYYPAPWLHFVCEGESRTCQPDGILVYPDRIFAFEVKHHHVPEAWWQLKKLYAPVLQAIFNQDISLVEVCRSYDPLLAFPEPVVRIDHIHEWVTEARKDFGVYVWRR